MADELIPREDESGEALGAMLKNVLSPVMETIAQLLKNNTEAVQALAAQQKVQSDRLGAIEQQIRLNTLVTPAQQKYIGAEIKKRSRELLAKKELEDDSKAVNAVSKAIRTAVLSRIGVAAVHDIPKYEYPVVMQQIDTWNDFLVISDASKAARKRGSASEAVSLQPPQPSAAPPSIGSLWNDAATGIEKDFSGLVEDYCHV